MVKNVDAEANARIFGILSLVFSFIPIVGLIFGVIATQKGRGGRSSFALTAGWIGIALSIFFASLFGYMRFNAVRQQDLVRQEAEHQQNILKQEEEKQEIYGRCLEEKSYSARLDIEAGRPNTGAAAQCEYLKP